MKRMLVAAMAMCGGLNSSVFADTNVAIGEQFDVLAGETFVNPDLFNNQGTTNNQGYFFNEGMFYNRSSGVLNNSSYFWNSGTLDNSGQINFQYFSTITVHQNGQLLNSGSISADGFHIGEIRLEDNGHLRNSGDLSYMELYTDSDTSILNTGTINHSGISGDGYYSEWIPGAQVMNTGTIVDSFIQDVGEMVNSGYIGGDITQGTGTSIAVRYGNIFTNTANGVIDLIAPQLSLEVMSVDGQFTNQGMINAYSSDIHINGASWSGIFTNENTLNNLGSRILINNGGVLRNQGTMTNGMEHMIYGIPEISLGYGGDAPSTLENSGTLENYHLIQGEGQVLNSGLLINHGSGSIDVRYLENSGRLETAGAISARDGFRVTETGTLVVKNVEPENVFFNTVYINSDMTVNGTLELELLGYPFDQYLNIEGVLDIGDTAMLNLSSLDPYLEMWMYGPGESIDLLSARQILGNFSEIMTDLSFDGLMLRLELEVYNNGFEDILRLNTVTAPVPLPAGVWLFISGLVGLMVTARKRSLH